MIGWAPCRFYTITILEHHRPQHPHLHLSVHQVRSAVPPSSSSQTHLLLGHLHFGHRPLDQIKYSDQQPSARMTRLSNLLRPAAALPTDGSCPLPLRPMRQSPGGRPLHQSGAVHLPKAIHHHGELQHLARVWAQVQFQAFSQTRMRLVNPHSVLVDSAEGPTFTVSSRISLVHLPERHRVNSTISEDSPIQPYAYRSFAHALGAPWFPEFSYLTCGCGTDYCMQHFCLVSIVWVQDVTHPNCLCLPKPPLRRSRRKPTFLVYRSRVESQHWLNQDKYRQAGGGADVRIWVALPVPSPLAHGPDVVSART